MRAGNGPLRVFLERSTRSQTTTLRELRALRLFKRDDVLERYLAAQREAGVPE